MPNWLSRGARCTSTLASSSHMERVRQLGSDLQHFGQGFMREGAIQRFVDVLQGHAVRQALQNQRNGQPRTANRQLSPEKSGISNDPLLFLVLLRQTGHADRPLGKSWHKRAGLKGSGRLAQTFLLTSAPDHASPPRLWQGLQSSGGQH